MALKSKLLVACSLFVLGWAGAAAAAQQGSALAVWEVPERWWQGGMVNGARLGRADGSGETLPAPAIRNLFEAQAKIAQASGMNIPVVFVDDPQPNGFASDFKDRQVIAITPALVRLLGEDQDAMAALLGHEFAHHQLGHTAQQRNARERNTNVAGGLLGGLARNFVGGLGGAVAGAAVNTAVTGIGRSFTRDEERTADDQGLTWTGAAGYDLCGGYRLMEKLKGESSRGLQLAFLSTHPGEDERMANASARAGRACDAPARALIPAVDTTPAPAAAPAEPVAGDPSAPAGADPYAPAGAAPPAQ